MAFTTSDDSLDVWPWTLLHKVGTMSSEHNDGFRMCSSDSDAWLLVILWMDVFFNQISWSNTWISFPSALVHDNSLRSRTRILQKLGSSKLCVTRLQGFSQPTLVFTQRVQKKETNGNTSGHNRTAIRVDSHTQKQTAVWIVHPYFSHILIVSHRRRQFNQLVWREGGWTVWADGY